MLYNPAIDPVWQGQSQNENPSSGAESMTGGATASVYDSLVSATKGEVFSLG